VLETVVVGGFTLLRMGFAANGRRTALFFGPFFFVHYGMFVAIQSVFLFMGVETHTVDWEGLSFAWMAAGFVVSHGQSFLIHYIRGGLYKDAAPAGEMIRPYARIFIQQFAAIFGFRLLGDGAMGSALIIVGLKTALDVWRHLAEHRGEAASVGPVEGVDVDADVLTEDDLGDGGRDGGGDGGAERGALR